MADWISAALDPVVVGSAPAHIDAVVLSTADPSADFVCTHVDRSGPVATVRMSARVSGTAENPAEGRCVRFPGQDKLTGVHSVAEILAESAIDEVAAVGTMATPDMLVDTRGFLRPLFQTGRLVLLVEPAAGGMLRPVEIEQPHQCCGGH